MATQAQITAVQQLYVSYLGRAADSAGLAFWSNAISTGTATVASVATGLTLANEYKTAYAGLTNDALVDKVYTNVLGRPADAAGKAFWVASFANGSVKADTFVASLISSLGTQDQQTINNKTFVAQTYTDTVGASYNPAAATSVLVGVDSTSASVNSALATINAGTLPGQVVGLNLINTQAAAFAAETSYETTNKAAVDTLATKLGVAVGADFDAELTSVSSAADLARTNVSTKTTTVLNAELADATTAQTNARTALDVAGKTKADAYVAAINTNTSLKAAVASDIAAAKAGLAADTGFADALAKVTAVEPTVTTIDALYAYYTNANTSTTARAAVDTDFAALTKFSAFKTTATTDITKNNAVKAEADAKIAIDGVDGGTFSGLVATTVAAKTTVDAATAADANKVAVDAIVTAHNAIEKAVADAGTAITNFNGASADTEIVAFNGAAAAATAAKETFYFATKATTADFAVSGFSTGDAIVLGNGYAFNGGALTSGNNSALEFFVVKGTTSTQIVVETAAYGNASTTLNADGTVNASPDAAVITLTGVTADHLSIANGVVSYV